MTKYDKYDSLEALLSAATMRWKSGNPAFAVEVYFSN
jgi:hypothetical protein